MIVPLLLALSTVPAAAQPAPAQPLQADRSERKACPDMGPRIATLLRKGVRPQRLDELPPGRLELSVFRMVDGCPIPAVVRERVGR